MEVAASSGKQSSRSNQTFQTQNSRRLSNTKKSPPTACAPSPITEAVDGALLIAALFACGYLAFPYFQLCYRGLVVTLSVVKDNPDCAVLVFNIFVTVFLVLGTRASVIMLSRYMAGGKKCEKPNCLGLRDSPKFDFQIETEEMMKHAAGSSASINGSDDILIELCGDPQREIHGQLKKVVPLNGRIVLIFRARCGCSAGRMVVWGPRKSRRIKK